MQLDKVVVIGRREYLSRIRTKSFWLSTIALPLFMGGVGLVPALLLTKTAVEQHLVVVDAVGGLGELLAEEMEERADRAIKLASFTTDVETGQVDAQTQRARLDARILAGEIDAWVWIDAEGLKNDTVEYHAESVSNFVTQSLLESSLSSVIRGYRLRQAGYDAEEIGDRLPGGRPPSPRPRRLPPRRARGRAPLPTGGSEPSAHRLPQPPVRSPVCPRPIREHLSKSHRSPIPSLSKSDWVGL